jgi:PIN domain nuclease of toxin-antitoxin system
MEMVDGDGEREEQIHARVSDHRDAGDGNIREGFQLLPISAEHGIRAGLLPGPHKDPFDRKLIAQSQAEDTPIISNESIFESDAVRRLR